VMIDKDLENKFWKQKIWSSLYERVHRWKVTCSQ
jgi:hypothetical protein